MERFAETESTARDLAAMRLHLKPIIPTDATPYFRLNRLNRSTLIGTIDKDTDQRR